MAKALVVVEYKELSVRVYRVRAPAPSPRCKVRLVLNVVAARGDASDPQHQHDTVFVVLNEEYKVSVVICETINSYAPGDVHDDCVECYKDHGHWRVNI